MKQNRLLLALAVLLLSAASARAQDAYPPQEQLEFVRKLRDNKGYGDLAMEYLEEMRRNAPAALQPVLQLEVAKTRLAMARHQDPEEWIEAAEQAQAELTNFLAKHADAPEAASVRQELKGLHGELARANLSLALRQRGIEAQQRQADKAKDYFQLSGADLEASIKEFSSDADIKQAHQARFALAINKMEQARCYINLAKDMVRTERAGLVFQARVIFEDLVRKDAGKIGLISKAWLVKCYSEDDGGEPQMSNKYYNELKKVATAKEADEAWRLARYFVIVRIPKMRSLTDEQKFKQVKTEADAWLKSYPGHYKTPLGYAVRYEQASAFYNEALATKNPKTKADLCARAQDILYALQESDNDLVTKIGELRSKIARIHLAGKNDANLSDLGTFDLCYVRSAIEFDRVQNLAKQIEETKNESARKDLDKKLREQLRDLIQALSRALSLAERRTPRYTLENVRYDLLAAYVFQESESRTATPYRTAIFGESLAKANPPSKHAVLAAEQAIRAYVRIVAADPSRSTREQFRNFAQWVVSPERQQQWENKGVVGLARYQLALLCQTEAALLFADAEKRINDEELLRTARDKFAEAVEHLRKLPKTQVEDQTRYIFGQSKAVFLALEARDKVTFPEEKKFYHEQARQLIAALPPQLPLNIHPTAIGMYFQARMEEAKFLYDEAGALAGKKDLEAQVKFKEMSKFLDHIAKQIADPSLTMEDARREQLNFYIGTMEKYSLYGQADIAYRAGKYDRALDPALAGKVIDFVTKQAGKDAVVRLKDFQITRKILGLAMRAFVQKGKIDEARKLLKMVENVKDIRDNAFIDNTGYLSILLSELDTEILAVHKTGNRDKLKLTLDRFSDFLNAVLLHAGNLEKKQLFILARCFDTLNKHDKAAELYRKYPAPAHLQIVKEKLSDDEERELQTYCYAQVMLARQLRLSRQLKEAKQILDTLSVGKNVRQLLLIEREQICLLEEYDLYGTAITRWNSFMNNPGFKGKDLAADAEKKKVYFDAYYHFVYCCYKYSQVEKVKKAGKSAQYLTMAAEYMVRLELSPNQEGWQLLKHRFDELMDNEMLLKNLYNTVKSGS